MRSSWTIGGSGASEILVVAYAQPVPRHVDTLAEARVIRVQPYEPQALVGREDLRDLRVPWLRACSMPGQSRAVRRAATAIAIEALLCSLDRAEPAPVDLSVLPGSGIALPVQKHTCGDGAHGDGQFGDGHHRHVACQKHVKRDRDLRVNVAALHPANEPPLTLPELRDALDFVAVRPEQLPLASVGGIRPTSAL